MQLKSVKQQETKFGKTLVAETLPQPQKFLLGFQIKPEEKLESVLQQAQSMMHLSSSKPNFGLVAAAFENPQPLSEETKALFESEYAPQLPLRLNNTSSTQLFVRVSVWQRLRAGNSYVTDMYI